LPFYHRPEFFRIPLRRSLVPPRSRQALETNRDLQRITSSSRMLTNLLIFAAESATPNVAPLVQSEQLSSERDESAVSARIRSVFARWRADSTHLLHSAVQSMLFRMQITCISKQNLS
jgi:hypothetical protein